MESGKKAIEAVENVGKNSGALASGSIIWSLTTNSLLVNSPTLLALQLSQYILSKVESKVAGIPFQQYVTEDQANSLADYDSHSSLVAALGVLIPVSLLGDIVDPMATQITLSLDAEQQLELVNNKGERIGEEFSPNSWQLSQHELSDVYLSDMAVGQHDFVLTSIAQFANGSEQKNVVSVELNVLDANNSPLGHFVNEQVGIEQAQTMTFSDDETLIDQNDFAQLEFDGELFENQLINDVFVWNIDEHGSLDNVAIDIMTDFKPEDRVNLTELLDGEHQGHFTEYLHVEYDASNDQTVLTISNDGEFDGTETTSAEYSAKANHEIVIEHVNLVGNAGDQATVIENLIANQQLVVNG